MKLRRIELTCYGAFTGRSVELGPGLTVVLGPNESGKSTLRYAVGDVLWGLRPQRHPYAFRYQPGALRLTAEIDAPEDPTVGVTIHVDSRSRRLDDDSVVTPWWTGGSVASREAWETSLGISLAELRVGTKAVMAGGGDLESLIFRARTGLDLESERDRLNSKGDDLYKWHAANRNVKVRVKAREVGLRREAVAEATSSADRVLGYRAAEDEARTAYDDAVTALAVATAALKEAERDERSLGTAHEIARVRAEATALEVLGRFFTTDQLAKYDATSTSAEKLARNVETLEVDITALIERIDRVEVDDRAVELESTVDELKGRMGLVRDKERSLGGLTADLLGVEDELRRLLRAIDPVAVPDLGIAGTELIRVATPYLLAVDIASRLDRDAEELTKAEETADLARREAEEAISRAEGLVKDDAGLDALAALAGAQDRRNNAWASVRDPWLSGELPDGDTRSELADAVATSLLDTDAAVDPVRAQAEKTGRIAEADELKADRLREAERLQAELSARRGRWSLLLRDVGAPTVLDAEAWSERHALLDEVAEQITRHGDLVAKHSAALSAVSEFRSDVDAAGASLGLEDRDSWVLLSKIADCVDRSVKGRERRRGDEISLEAKRADRERLHALLVIELERLAAFDEGDDLQVVVERSRELVRLRASEERLLDELARIAGSGTDVEALLVRLRDYTEEDVQEALLRGRGTKDDANLARDVAHTNHATAQQELARAEAVGSAAELQAEALETAEQLAALVDEFVQVRVQSLILSRVLAAESPDAQNGLLAHAEVLAARLTGGRIQGLKAEETDIGRRLRIEAEALNDGGPGELSEGTADQVYLALRLAGIREQQAASVAAGQPTLPVVLDDVLQAHDDARTSAAIHVLIEEAREQQIVLLTHHAAVAAVAAELGANVVTLDPLPDLSLVPQPAPARGAPAGALGDAPDPSLVRAWAKGLGIPVAERGRIAGHLVAAYLARDAPDVEG